MQIKQNTVIKIPFFMVDATDSITGKTGLSPTVTLSKDGAGFVSAVGSVTEIGLGWYYLTPSTSGANDIGTLGSLALHATATGADPFDEVHQVFVDITGGAVASVTAIVSANLTQILGTTLTETAGLIAAGFKQFFNIATPTSTMNTITTVSTVSAVTGLTASNLDATVSSRLASGSYTAPPSAATIAAAVWDFLTSAMVVVGSIGKLIKDNLDGTVTTRAPSATALSTATWTSGRASAIDFLDVSVASRASQSSVNNIQNNTNFAGIVQSPLILPDSGSKVYPFYVRLFDEIGAPIDPDTNIMNYTIKDSSGGTVVAQTAMTRTGVGQYTASYTVNSSDQERALFFFFDYAVLGVSFNQVRSTEVQEFESKLDTLVSRLTAQRALNLDNLDETISSRLADADYTAPDNATITAINAKTTQLGFTSGNVNANAIVVSDKTGYVLAVSTIPIKFNTAFNGFTFSMYDAAGLPATGLTVTAKRSIDGAAVATCANAVSEVSLGLYKINFASTDLNGGNIAFIMSAPGALSTIFTVVTQ